MAVRLTTFAYPWDLARLGVDRALEQLVAEGFDGVHLAATYHPIDALSPRGGEVRLFASGRGAVHFPARPERYGRIKPSVSSPEVGAAWPAVVERASTMGLEVVPWTIVLYQPWIVDQHPDCARVLPSGDRIDAGVCPSNDDVREYVGALCDDLVDQFGVDTLHLEGVAHTTYDYGWLRPRSFVTLSRLGRELAALCFCASCRRRGTDAGLDVDRMQRLADGVLRVDARVEPPPATDPVAGIDEDTELRAFVLQHVRASTELVADVVSRVQAPVPPRLSAMAWTPFSTLLGSEDDAAYDEAISPFDQVFVSPTAANDRTRVAMERRRSRPFDLAVLLSPSNLSAMAPVAGTPLRGGDSISEVLRGAVEVGAAEVALYNWGLLREADTLRLAGEIRAAFA